MRYRWYVTVNICLCRPYTIVTIHLTRISYNIHIYIYHYQVQELSYRTLSQVNDRYTNIYINSGNFITCELRLTLKRYLIECRDVTSQYWCNVQWYTLRLTLIVNIKNDIVVIKYISYGIFILYIKKSCKDANWSRLRSSTSFS